MLFISIMKFVRGYVYVHLTGYAPERFLNLCGKNDILIWDLQVVEDGYLFHISMQGFKMLRPILKKTKTKVVILEKKGLPMYFFRYRKRKLFVAGLLFCVAMLVYVSGFVWNIEVCGNSYLSEETILTFLEEEDAYFGTKISQIDCATLEEKLRSEYPEVIWTSIKIYGTKMTIDIQESLLSEDSYQTTSEEVCDIVASKDGIIVQMITRQGTPLVKIGNEVKRGDCLVSGELPITSDYGEVVTYIYECADADILAQVQYTYQETISRIYQEKIYQSNAYKNYILQIGDIIIKNPFIQEPEGLYDVTVEAIQLKLGPNFYLPVYFKKITYNSYELEQKEYTEEEIKALAKKDFLQYQQKLEEKGIQIVGKNVMIKKASRNQYLVTGTVDAYESIVSYTPTVIREINEIEGQVENESD